jgi:diguanylate cyclase (GGDEF)-like protein
VVPLVLERAPETVVVMISGEGGIDSAVGALRAGAYDYVRKPFDAEDVKAVVRRALDHRGLLAAKRRYERDLERLVAERTFERDHLTYYDPLTDLPNRALFEDRHAHPWLSRAGRGNLPLAVVVYSLDRLGAINETLGYVNGDEALRAFAGRLSAALSGDDTVARRGGNEFAVLLTQVRGAEDVVMAVRAILDSVKSSERARR